MTNLNKLIKRRQGELQMFLTEDDGSGNVWLDMSLKETYRQALLDLQAVLPGEKEKVFTDDFEMRNYKNDHNTALQTVRAQIEGLLSKIS